jgi:hypothetical protein
MSGLQASAFFRFAMERFAWSAWHDRSTCCDRMPRSEHTALFERARGRGSGGAAQERWCSIGWPAGTRMPGRGATTTPYGPRSVQGSGSSRATTVGFALEGRGGDSPAPTGGSTRRAGSGGNSGLSVGEKRPPASPLITRNRSSHAGLRPCAPRGENRSDAAVLSPRPSLRWLRSEANALPRSAPELAVGARDGRRPTA